MKTLLTATFVLAMLGSASAQTLDINLDALAAKAKDKAEITLEGSLLAQVLQMAPEKVKGAVANVTRVDVRHYEFDQTGQYSDTDLDAVRKQVSNWPRILNVKEQNENVEIYMLSQDGKPAGFLLIAAEPKQLTVVHVAGSIDLASLREVVNSTIHYDLKGLGGQ
jgi:hypothetical protein